MGHFSCSRPAPPDREILKTRMAAGDATPGSAVSASHRCLRGRPFAHLAGRLPEKASRVDETVLTVIVMARMTPQEATAVNVLLGYLAAKEDRPPREVVRALETLASRAHNRLQTGWDETAVMKQWPHAYETGTPNSEQ